MIQQRLQEWILHPESLDEDSLFELREILKRYPYFQTARLLYLKNLFLLKDAGFKEELKRSVLYVADLSQLFYYIEGEHFVIEKHDTQADSLQSGGDRTLALIDRFLAGSSLSASTPSPAVPAAARQHTEPAVADDEIKPEVSMDYTAFLMQEEKTEEPVRMKGQDLIDSFIEASQEVHSEEAAVPLPPAETEEALPEETAEEEVKPEEESQEEDYFTETLAKIYVKQKRYDKALEIIKKLNLKYPKKNAYFADQIRFLEKLIINAKSK